MNARLHIRQPSTGYRFSLDPLILAWHLRPAGGAHILDIGTGCGVIPLILARNYPDLRITGIEIQKMLADCAVRNVLLNHLDDRVRIQQKDIRKVGLSEIPSTTFITCNPPHTAKAAGRINPNPQRAVARHEILMTLMDLLAAAGRLLEPGGRLLTIYPVSRMEEVLQRMPSTGLAPQKQRMIHFKTESPATRFFIEAVKGPPARLETLPPLKIHETGGAYTPEALALFEFSGLSNPGEFI